jgi:hypothetical protein
MVKDGVGNVERCRLECIYGISEGLRGIFEGLQHVFEGLFFIFAGLFQLKVVNLIFSPHSYPFIHLEIQKNHAVINRHGFLSSFIKVFLLHSEQIEYQSGHFLIPLMYFAHLLQVLPQHPLH